MDEDISSPEAGLLLVVPDPVPLLDEPLPLPDPEPELDCAPETAEPLFWSFEGTLSLLRLLICDWSCFFDFWDFASSLSDMRSLPGVGPPGVANYFLL
jgi:hypothetical protein